MVTKEQERKALAQIRKIVEGLGQDSYIGMAFEGCFDMAEENIENDFACSMKQRAESAERMLASTSSELRNLKTREAELTEKCSNLESKVLTGVEVEAIKAILSHARLDAATLADSAAQRIVETADKPGSPEFRQAVQHNRAGKRRVEECENILKRLMEITN